LAAELKGKFGADTQVDMIPSSGGVFEIVVDGKLVFSKKNLGRFPDDGEAVGLIQ